MSISLIYIGLLLGLDSLAVGTGLGAAIQDRNRRRWLALSFALCDGLASWIGTVIGAHSLHSSMEWREWVGPSAVAAYGVYVLFLAWRCQRLTAEPSRCLVFSLPLCLSLDNLTVGIGLEASGVPSILVAPVFGLLSGGLALLGLQIGSALSARSRFQPGWLSGVLLLLVAGGLILKEAVIDLTVNQEI
jgi:putative Mn2+ efflux pump MntP